MGGGRRVDEGGAVGNNGGVAMAEKRPSSQECLRELGTVETTLSDDTSYVAMQLSLNTITALNLKRTHNNKIIITLIKGATCNA